MLKLDELFVLLDKYAPMELDRKMIQAGEHDNSGILVKTSEEVNGVLFSLDLSEEAVRYAKRVHANTIVTHHPAIYYPINNLRYDEKLSSAVLMAAENKINVISMHLNLDVADTGIDYYLSNGLGAKTYKIIMKLDETHGYGREFTVGLLLKDFVKKIKENFKTDKVIYYGKPSEEVKKVASFCGGGGSMAVDAVRKNLTDADLVLSSDLSHHMIKELVEAGKKIVILPHYVAEEYGFNKFYEYLRDNCDKKVSVNYFVDKRFF